MSRRANNSAEDGKNVNLALPLVGKGKKENRKEKRKMHTNLKINHQRLSGKVRFIFKT